MWESEIQHIELEKSEGGLGFSILDYQVLGTLGGNPLGFGFPALGIFFLGFFLCRRRCTQLLFTTLSAGNDLRVMLQ
jgi:hypothetical protein